MVVLGTLATVATSSPPEAKVATPTTLIDADLIGKPAPSFSLPDLDGKTVQLSDYSDKTLVIEWFNPECPFVKNAHGSKGSLRTLAADEAKNGVAWLAINSGAPGKQGNDTAKNKEAAAAWNLTHPILKDETGVVGKAYGATNTPHLYVIDKGVVVYAGAIDNSKDGEGQSPEGGTLINHVAVALQNLRDGAPVAVAKTKAYGCSVKYQ